MKPLMVRVRVGLVAVTVLGVAGSATAQESRSSALAKQFTDALGGANLMAIAAKDASQPDVYVAAMSVPGMLLVVSSKFSVPAALDDKLLKKDYQDVYLDLQSASDAATKMFIQDVNADGLKFKTFDVVDTAAGSRTFDGDWKKAKAASEQAYQKSFADTDEQYAKMLSLLLAALKKP